MRRLVLGSSISQKGMYCHDDVFFSGDEGAPAFCFLIPEREFGVV